MKRSGRMKLLSIFMAAVLVFGALPGTALAAEPEEEAGELEEVSETESEEQVADDAGEVPSTEEAVEDDMAEDQEDPGIAVLSEMEEEDENEIMPLATASVTYVDENNSSHTVTATEVTSDDTEWTGGWYVVDSDVTNSNRITVSGTVNLILVDDCTLTASSGIAVETDSLFTIYGQSKGTGTLRATGNNYYAGIGAGYYHDGGSITICGGIVTATGGNRGAGIGGANDGSCGTITICGGIVTANGGYGGAGIGSGWGRSCDAVTISGGTVTVNGGDDAAGIGSGRYGNCDTVTISGGTVTTSGYAGGIGNGIQHSGSLTFSTGNNGHAFIVASSISDTSSQSSWSGAIIIGSSGQVYGTPTLTTDAEVPSGDTLHIPSGTSLTIGSGVTLTNSGLVYQEWGSNFTKTGTYTNNGTTYYQIINNLTDSWPLSGTTSYNNQLYAKENDRISTNITQRTTYYNYTVTRNDSTAFTADERIFIMPDQPVTLSGGDKIDVPYPWELAVPDGELDEDYTYNDEGVLTIISDNALTVTMAEGIETATTEHVVIDSGVNANLTLDGVHIDMSSNTNTAAIDLREAGTSAITLAEGSDNTLKSGQNRPGIEVPNGNEITFDGGGTLTVTGGADGAGIGTGNGESGNNIVTINGGTITTTGGDHAAGIGDANSGSAKNTITINGGTVTANGTVNGAGIGKGASCSGASDITITGGMVTVNGSYMGSAIGTAYNSTGTQTITISGGTVIANQKDGDTSNHRAYGISGTFSTGTNGHAVIYANSMSSTSGSGSWSGIISPSSLTGEAVVYGTPTITTDEIIPSGKTARIADGKNVTIADGYTLTNEGTLYQEWGSTFTKEGTYTDNGSTYYEVVSEIEGDSSLYSIDGLTTNSSRTYAKHDTQIDFVIEDGYTFDGLVVEKNSEGTVTASDEGFTMPDDLVKITAEVKKKITEDMFEVDTDSETYTGMEIMKTISGSDDGSALTEDTDYTVTYEDNKDVGTATITIKGTGDYAGTLTYTFTINPAVITEDMFSVNEDPETYNGGAFEKEISGTYGDLAMTEGTDYTVEYADNTNAGMASITITGKGNYTGTLTYQFEIKQAQQIISYAETSVNKYDYDDSFTNELTQDLVYGDITYSYTIGMGDEPVIELNETTGEVAIKNPGIVTITATASGSADYLETTATYILTVNSDLIGVEIDVNNDAVDYDDGNGEYIDKVVYDGQDLELEMVLDLDSDELAHLTLHSVDYQWYSYDFDADTFSVIDGATESAYTLTDDDVDAGDYIYLCVAAVIYDNGYEHTVYSVIEIAIDKADQKISYDEETITKNTADDDFTNPLTQNVISGDADAGITYTSSNPSVATVDEKTGEVHVLAAGETTITATAAETDNYNEATASYTLTVTAATLSASVTVDDDTEDYNDKSYTKTYDEEGFTLTVTPASDPDVDITYTYQWSKADTEITDATGATLTIAGNVSDSGTYTCEVTGTYANGNTASVTATVTVEVEKAQQSISYAEATVEKYDYDDPFTNELTRDLVYGDITYSYVIEMGDEPVIELDDTTGEVTIKNPGVVTITATASGSDDYEEATASYILVVNSDLIGVEIDVNNDAVDYDDDTGEYVDKLVYDGQDLELEMILDLNSDELAHLTLHSVDYQWYSYDFDAGAFDAIDGATESTYTLTGDAVNAGDYIYLCVAAVVYDNGYEHTVYGIIEIAINKADQEELSFEKSEITTTEDGTVDNPLSGAEGTVTYTSSDENVATVDPSTGEVTIVGTGIVTITATAAETENYNETAVTYTLTVVGLSVTIGGEEDISQTYDGEPIELEVNPVVDPEVEGVTYTYQWYMDDEEIDGATDVALTLNGDVADSGIYTCVVTATVNGVEMTDEAKIEVTIDAAKQDISYEETELEKTVGDVFTNPLTETAVSTDTDATVTYTSSDESVATVDENGQVIIVGVGTATITATAAATANYTEASAAYTITTADEIAVSFDPESVSKTYDDNKVTVTAQASSKVSGVTFTYVWTDEDDKEVGTGETLTLAGNVTDSGTYTCTVTVIYPNGAEDDEVTGTVDIKIEKAEQDAHFAEPDLSKTTDSGSFENPLAGIEGDVTYSISGDEGVAEIDPVTGEVTLIGGTGTVIITATIAGDENHDDATISYTLTVTEPIPDHTHKYELVDWIIDPATGDVYAEFKCECGDIIFEKADVTSEITKEPTETEDGVRTYTATVEYDGETYTTSWTEDIPALDTDTEPGPVVENPDGGAKTGDTNNIMLWLVLLIAAAAIVLVLMRRRNVRK